MKTRIFLLALLMCTFGILSARNSDSDTTKTVNLDQVIIRANRLPVKLKNNPGAISLVTPKMLNIMPKGIAAEEALRLVPGVRIDNQHDGERVHISIRGQGILTERGLRGIGVYLDGIPLNDPSGFAPDLYGVDWNTIRRIEVLRGPAAGIYGSGGAAGVINIETENGGPDPIGGELSETVGSNGFFKTHVGLGGSKDNINYRVSYTRTDGDGYRDHQAFWSNKLYEKVNFHPSEKLSVTQIISHTDYFHQNPEGLNLGQLDEPTQANPDARPFNEYQKTNRTTVGFHGKYRFSEVQDVEATAYLRSWRYKETSNRAAEYSDYTTPGASAQYNLHLKTGEVRHDISVGTDLKWQQVKTYKLKSASDPNRVESTDETNIETDTLLANERINQRSIGAFALYKHTAGKFNLLGSVRYDAMYNELTDKMAGADTATTSKDFDQVSARVGISYSLSDAATLFANWSQGFMPPSTEELASNPTGYSGFNTHLVPATSNCFEIGSRGFIADKLYYELTGFYMKTENDFFRFKQHDRGNQEVFYGNAGNSERYGIEAFLAYDILSNLSLQVAYTYAHYTYTSATIDPVYTDTTYVLTTPPESGQYLPNSPKHQLFAELIYSPGSHFRFSLSTEYQSEWAIYTDAKAYHNELDPAVYQNWQDGFNLFHASATYKWKLKGLNGEIGVFAGNLTDQKYMAFTEPDPDGNAYQSGPGRELFATLKIRF